MPRSGKSREGSIPAQDANGALCTDGARPAWAPMLAVGAGEEQMGVWGSEVTARKKLVCQLRYIHIHTRVSQRSIYLVSIYYLDREGWWCRATPSEGDLLGKTKWNPRVA